MCAEQTPSWWFRPVTVEHRTFNAAHCLRANNTCLYCWLMHRKQLCDLFSWLCYSEYLVNKGTTYVPLSQLKRESQLVLPKLESIRLFLVFACSSWSKMFGTTMALVSVPPPPVRTVSYECTSQSSSENWSHNFLVRWAVAWYYRSRQGQGLFASGLLRSWPLWHVGPYLLGFSFVCLTRDKQN